MRYCLFLLPLLLCAQPGTERSDASPESPYLAEWPAGPPRESVPAWAAPGNIRFSRWDGGPIETAKAFLSGWPGFNPPIPDYIDVMTNWYRPSTIALLHEAGINTIWVTLSNGFSIPTEAGQRELLRRYIDECHRQGIHVMAYHSVANVFWEDMYEHVPESRSWISLGRDGKPVPYGAGDYTRMGRVTRYMADLSRPGWRNYLKQRIDLAIDAGADGIMYDNCYSPYLSSVFQEIMNYALSRKRDFLVMANFHRPDFIENRLINAITSEEGGEAGIFTAANLAAKRNRWQSERDAGAMLPVAGGYLATNIGRFRIFDNLSDGWKPVMIESRLREVGEAETHVISARRHQLVMAENMMFNVANELFVEGRFAYGLWNREPEIMGIWHAIGRYNSFFNDNREYYVGARLEAALAVVLDNTSAGEEILNGLAARNVMYDVLYEHQLTPGLLRPYTAVAALGRDLRPRARAALDAYVAAGGRRIAVGPPSAIEQLAAALRAAEPAPLVRLNAPPGVLYNVTRQPDRNRTIVHLANYLPDPADKLSLTVRGRYRRVQVLSPDVPRECAFTRHDTPDATTVELPGLNIYTLVVFEP